MLFRILLATLAMALLAALSGCASLPAAQTTQLAEREIELVAQMAEGPVVVFENGLGGRMEWWSKVLPRIAEETAVFAYNRPGYGNSSPVQTPRDGQSIVDELRQLLQSQGLQPPYVLVGHSLGGLYMQLFARKYPQDVAALVLVDSTHPQQLEGAGALENQSLFVRSALKLLITGTARQELELLKRSGEQVLGLPTVTGIPVFILSAKADPSDNSEAAQFARQKRAELATLYPGARQIWVEGGHAIPIENPDAVIAAIQAALALIRERR
ncbi:pimeloyl-ACP methyl ester carboxylesterase [Paucibacter oligotrophus]|uniref:Pimeloyl-ACP methyl ester carboxylesterase n=1 Tax=Roseateles oligotrophus TaxID=1769250 RepID=A0A840L7P1_9BURK|nr:alpha/beta hydrolase family protein [Roseateles oligotrophus]MBB4844584.1 pimeloyl-ACP methyl ester carboxylesterase [Roseateles oligotrophus]